MCLGKALYDNIAETPDELAFRRGDILTIIDRQVVGLDGWWLCQLRGKKGIAPANRLQLLAAGIQPPEEEQPRQNCATKAEKTWNRRSWNICPDKVRYKSLFVLWDQSISWPVFF